MQRPPPPNDAVPEFVLERFEGHTAETLRDIARYARTDSPSADVPQYVVEAFTLRDESTRRAIGSHASRLAEYLDALEEADAETTVADVVDAPAEADADESRGIVIGPFFG